MNREGEGREELRHRQSLDCPTETNHIITPPNTVDWTGVSKDLGGVLDARASLLPSCPLQPSESTRGQDQQLPHLSLHPGRSCATQQGQAHHKYRCQLLREGGPTVSDPKLHIQKNCGNLRQPRRLRLVLANLSHHRPTQRPKSEARKHQPPENGFALTVP